MSNFLKQAAAAEDWMRRLLAAQAFLAFVWRLHGNEVTFVDDESYWERRNG